jgi:hypothetical protein
MSNMDRHIDRLVFRRRIMMLRSSSPCSLPRHILSNYPDV